MKHNDRQQVFAKAQFMQNRLLKNIANMHVVVVFLTMFTFIKCDYLKVDLPAMILVK